ncbi:MAG: type II toxin-antitoxin system VapC family toxin, partial [Deltaproteobacteria bacterium]|nr:type II toxin-antitoxin system VapC family toxin [Deltaproteobacteria bacterium]
MKILLDTCTFLWIIWDAKELSKKARELYADPGNEIYLSTVSCWEISLKHGLGRLPLAAHPQEIVPDQRR